MGHDHENESPAAAQERAPAAAASAAVAEHRAHAPSKVACYIVTCSDSRARADDASGRALLEGLVRAGHPVVGQVIVQDEADAIRGALQAAQLAGAQAVLFTGGTGLTRRDQTVDTLGPLLDRELPGFGELFRMLSYQEIGSAAWLSRALAGTYGELLVFLLPGSPNAAKLALEKLILPELGHAIRELSR
ncbi:MAG: molybdenum cofactor biosynthesis protein B [Myxococcaceae bacterium]